jgi:pimeloyl-ACP methyl ester carboxylesterase
MKGRNVVHSTLGTIVVIAGLLAALATTVAVALGGGASQGVIATQATGMARGGGGFAGGASQTQLPSPRQMIPLPPVPYQVGTLPPDSKPVIPADQDIILYVHGGPGSRLEEATDLVKPLLDAGRKKGIKYTIISFDQPNQGYSSMVDPFSLVPSVLSAAPTQIQSENPACVGLRAQEAALGGYMLDAQVKLVQMGKEQQQCQAGIGPDGRRTESSKPPQCGALEDQAEKKTLNASVAKWNAQLQQSEKQKKEAGCWWPITADQEDAIHTGVMHTHVSISNNADGSGNLLATTRSWADNIEGFTGSVAVAILDQSDVLLWSGGTPCGVGAFDHQTCSWSGTIRADKLSKARYLAIKHKYTPKREDIDGFFQSLLPKDFVPLLTPIIDSSWANVDKALGHATIRDYYPLVGFSEEFIAAFLDQFNTITPGGIRNRNIYVIGGSTGGALTLRMGRRTDLPWIKKIVAWNPASVWTTYTNDVAKGVALDTGFARSEALEDANSREDYFNSVFGMTTKFTQPNPEEWYRGDRDHYYPSLGKTAPEWACKWDYIAASRLEMQEVYNPAYRRWHWRLGTELLVFSFFNDDWFGPANTAGKGKPANYSSILKPTLLAAADDDDWSEGSASVPSLPGMPSVPVILNWENRWTQTRLMAPLMKNTPLSTLYLSNTGHSIHNERPQLFATQIAAFLSSPASIGSPLAVTPPFDEICSPQMSQFPPIPPQLLDDHRSALDNAQAAIHLKENALLGGQFSDSKNAGYYSLRLNSNLKAVAQKKDPAFALGMSAATYYGGDQGAAYSSNAVLWGNAFADLAVTGRTAYDNFRKNPPADDDILRQARNILRLPPTVPKAIDEKLRKAVATAKTRAYQVAWALRNPDPAAAYKFRSSLGWIAVSGEDDPPARPVNVPSGIPIFAADGKTQVSAYPQYELQVTICPTTAPPYVPHQCAPGAAGSVPFQIRYAIASAQ